MNPQPQRSEPKLADTHEEWCEAFIPYMNKECNCPAGEKWHREQEQPPEAPDGDKTESKPATDDTRKYQIGQRVGVSEVGWHEVTNVDDQGFSFDIYIRGIRSGSGYSPHQSTTNTASLRSASEQEWTPLYVANLAGRIKITKGDKRIADAHEAALKSERDRAEKAAVRAELAQIELKAEREKSRDPEP